jgi:hypothetical protein
VVLRSTLKWSEYPQTLQLNDVLCRTPWCFAAAYEDARLDVAPCCGLGQVRAAQEERAAVGDREFGVQA